MSESARLAAALGDRYRLERELGAGGMATVYLAQDLKHHRRVAIKVLHPELSAILGSERFLKEIELTANLQHPHVLPLFDSGEADGLLYYVMPFVEGETLRSRLEREQQLPVADAVRIALNVADALEYAHRHGVVHRDIKPENILLHDGRPLVADFGIALAVQEAGGSRMTQTGISLGTPQYMAPEQAMGDRHVDLRTDIYALGVVAFEMLAGEPPFTAPSSQAIVARVMTEKPRSLRSLRDTVPAHVAEAVHTALQKLPADRFPSAAAFARALENPGFMPTAIGGAAERLERQPARVTPAVLVLGGLLLAVGILALWGWLRPLATPVPRVAWQLPVPIPDTAPVTNAVSLSRDGALLVYGGGRPGAIRLWLWRADGTTVTPIPGTEDAENPALSPDGRRVAFQRSGRLYVVPVEGGKATMVADSVVLLSQPAWLDDHHLVFANQGGLERVGVEGGRREPVTSRDSAAREGWHVRPEVLPDGRGIVFTIGPLDNDDPAAARIAVTNPGGGHSILMPGRLARYAHPGHLLIARSDGVLFAVPFDVSARRVTGSARPVATGLGVAAFNYQGFAVSPGGRVVFVAGSPNPPSDLVRVLRNGQASPMDTAWAEVFSISASPDGRHVAAQIRTPTTDEIHIRDLATGGITRIAIPGQQLRRPSYSRDGATLVFTGLSPSLLGIYRVSPGASSPPELLLQLTDPPSAPALSPDGQTLYFATTRGSSGDLLALALDSPGTPPRPILATAAREVNPVPSPDGHWLAYLSDESGRVELFVRSADPGRAERWQVSRSGVRSSPCWSRDGRELFYISLDSLFAARLASGDHFEIANRTALFPAAPYTGFDVMPGGDFLMIRPRPVDPRARRLIMLEHWNAGSGR